MLTHITVVALENIVEDPVQWLTNRCGASYFVRWYISYMIFSLYGGTLDCGLPEGESKPWAYFPCLSTAAQWRDTFIFHHTNHPMLSPPLSQGIWFWILPLNRNMVSVVPVLWLNWWNKSHISVRVLRVQWQKHVYTRLLNWYFFRFQYFGLPPPNTRNTFTWQVIMNIKTTV